MKSQYYIISSPKQATEPAPNPSAPSYPQPTPSYPQPSYQQPNQQPSYQQPSYQQPSTSYQQPSTSYQQPSTSYQQPSTSYQQPSKPSAPHPSPMAASPNPNAYFIDYSHCNQIPIAAIHPYLTNGWFIRVAARFGCYVVPCDEQIVDPHVQQRARRGQAVQCGLAGSIGRCE